MSMLAMSNSSMDLFHCQQRIQNDTTSTFQVIHQAQQDHANDNLIHHIPTFYGKPEL